MLVIWKLRARPRRLISNGGSPVDRRSPFSRIAPRVGAKRPLIRLNSVDLPAPLGPMIACRSPGGIARSTPRMISVLPKLLRSVAAARARRRGHVAPPAQRCVGARSRAAPGAPDARPSAGAKRTARRRPAARRRAEPGQRARGVERDAERASSSGPSAALTLQVVDHLDDSDARRRAAAAPAAARAA